jgi:Spy/CpxP family protein refolding chaperone
VKIWKVIISVLAIFTAGLFTGALLNNVGHPGGSHWRRLPFRDQAVHRAAAPQPPPPAVTNHEPAHLNFPGFVRPPGKNIGRDFLERVGRELELTADQRQQVEKILEQSQQRTREIWESVSPQLREEMKTSREKMRAVLTPEQIARFDELMKLKQPRPGPTNPPPAVEPKQQL